MVINGTNSTDAPSTEAELYCQMLTTINEFRALETTYNDVVQAIFYIRHTSTNNQL